MKPPKFRFYLEPKNKDPKERTEEELIMVSISYGYSKKQANGKNRAIPCRIAVEAKMKPSNFGRIETGYKFDPNVFQRYSRSNRTIENKMNRIKEEVWKLESKYVSEGKMPTPEELKEELLVRLKRKERTDVMSVSILEFLKEDIKRYESGTGRNSVDRIKENTIKTYRTLKTLLEEYQITTGKTIYFDGFDEDYYWNFWDVTDEILRGVREVDNPNRSKRQTKNKNGYSVNSIRKYQDAFIKTLNRAKEQGFKSSLDTTKKGLKLPGADSSKNIFVTISELKQIIKADVSYDNSLQTAKDYIIISCLTGMRYQSMSDTSTQQIELYVATSYNFKYILSRQAKTGTEVYMPLLKPVRQILESYDGVFPKWPANGTINKKLKQLFELIGIDAMSEEKITTYKFGEIIKKRPKYELISAHDGRKSFISNLEELKVNRDVVDQMTHPDKKPKNPMRKIYDKRDLISKAKDFVDEVSKLDCDLYKL
ncbi:phage integrase SAM-like domain-containing protein [Zunongwangia sp. F363]|uniref:Phage integrase SAM-like domain-containing protein n=1 Tax=Autumnicola tepida TaxID=3075595 RepID=A0ABU3CAF4_9FLAO|nr:phage integrase SAM-like domain-containing protein [Zunongwangia sp. F363]MDT0643319.1 phage integrase SAM-like domain-containing protein [Zunongwangia sp. F363]